jgi:hypothetical protein
MQINIYNLKYVNIYNVKIINVYNLNHINILQNHMKRIDLYNIIVDNNTYKCVYRYVNKQCINTQFTRGLVISFIIKCMYEYKSVYVFNQMYKLSTCIRWDFD